MYLLLAVVTACLVPKATVLQRDALRNVAVLLTLVPFVIASRPLLPAFERGRRD